MSACARCGATSPNKSCYVCAEVEPDPEWFEHDWGCRCHHCAADRLADEADRLRDERRDREWEESMNQPKP